MPLSMVVDDSKVVRTVSRRILEDLGYDVVEAEDGQDALNKAKEGVPELILLDWNMPVMNGLEFLLAFRQFKEHASTKVIFCTTENDITKIQEAIASGADEYVMKPFDSEIIKGKLQQLGMID